MTGDGRRATEGGVSSSHHWPPQVERVGTDKSPTAGMFPRTPNIDSGYLPCAIMTTPYVPAEYYTRYFTQLRTHQPSHDTTIWTRAKSPASASALASGPGPHSTLDLHGHGP